MEDGMNEEYGSGDNGDEEESQEHESEEAFDLLKKQFIDWEDSTWQDRVRNMRDRDYYDGVQWTKEESALLEKRNQPAIVFNRIATKINYVMGTEIDARVDPRAYPRNPASEDDSEAITDALRFVAQADRFLEKRTLVADDFFVEGTGALVLSIENKKDDVPDVTTGYIPWDRFFFDPYSRLPNFADASFMGEMVWMDTDEARADYPEAEDIIDRALTAEIATDDTTQDRPRRWWSRNRERIQIFETFWIKYDKKSKKPQWHQAVWCYGGFLEYPSLVDFVDEKGDTWCPIIASSCYVRKGTAETNERYGCVRNMVGPQDEINHRRSKAIHMMHTTGVIAEDGVVENPDEFQAQLSRPDGFAVVQPGGLTEGRMQLRENTALLQPQVVMLQDARAEIDNMGPRPVGAVQDYDNARLFIAHQEAGALELKPVFDNLKALTLQTYRCYWWLVRQYWKIETWKRIIDDAADIGYKFVTFNRKMTRVDRLEDLMANGMAREEAVRSALGSDGLRIMTELFSTAQREIQQAYARVAQAAQEEGEQPQPPPTEDDIWKVVLARLAKTEIGGDEFTKNDVTKLDVDIVLETAPHSAILEHEQYKELVGLAKADIGLTGTGILKMIVQASSLRDKKKIINAIDAPPTPEQQQQQQQQQQLQMAQMEAQVAKLQAEVQKAQAEAQLVSMKAQHEQVAAQLDAAKAQLVAAQTETEQMEPSFRQDELDIDEAKLMVEARNAGANSANAAANLANNIAKIERSK